MKLKNETSYRNLKIVLFDLMDEYTGLLIDLLVDENINGMIICIGEDTIPNITFEFINRENEDLEKAAKAFVNQMYIPKKLRDLRDKYEGFIRILLKNRSIRIVEEIKSQTVKEFIDENWNDVIMQLGSVNKGKLEVFREEIFGEYYDKELTPELAKEILNKIEGFGSKSKVVMEVLKDSKMKERLNYTILSLLRKISKYNEKTLAEDAIISLDEIVKDLNNVDKPSLYIITSYDPHKVREFSSDLGWYLYNSRRNYGILRPLVLFIFDEADEFIPQSPTHESYKKSKNIIETLTRRGRKFGIGVGLATQRSAYLDTNIMGQLHTYFISKLPRRYDREVVADAFSLPESEFVQTFKFRRGEWLLVSHDATGVESVPIPIYVQNAEERIKKAFESYKGE